MKIYKVKEAGFNLEAGDLVYISSVIENQKVKYYLFLEDSQNHAPKLFMTLEKVHVDEMFEEYK